MSYSYERVETRRNRSYGASGRRTLFGHWVPLVLTVSVATIGLVAWIWSERRDDDEDDYPDRAAEGPPPPGYSDLRPGETSFARSTAVDGQQQVQDENSMMARMSGALRRSPSPQQLFDGASKRVAAGVAAAGAMVGGALSSIREEDKGNYEDHSRWSEEAETRNNGIDLRSDTGGRGVTAGTAANLSTVPLPILNKKRKSVAIVVSSVTEYDSQGHEVGGFQEHASILSHLPQHLDTDTTRVFVLIYAPDLKQHPLNTSPSSRPTASMTSSFSNIGHDEAHTPREFPGAALSSVDPNPMDDPLNSTPLFRTLYNQAQALVERETMIMPFTTPTGHVHLLRHLGPETVYIQESLCGKEGDVVTHLSGWVRQVVIVVGDEGGHGGLIDSEDEVGAAAEKGEKWWQKEDVTGLGKGIDIVDGLRVGEDWRRRVTGHD